MGLMGSARLLYPTGYIGERGCSPLIGSARGKVGREAFSPHDDTTEGDVAIDEQHGIGGMVVALDEVAGMGRGEALDMLRGAEDIVPEGMASEEEFLEVIENELGGIVLVAVYLLEDDTALLVHLVLGVGAVEDNVSEQFEGARKILLQEGRVDDRLLLVGIGIEVATDILHAVEYVPSATLCGALEEHVLDEVGQTSLVGLLVARAAIDGIATIDHRSGRRVVYDAQTIGEGGSVTGLHRCCCCCCWRFFSSRSAFFDFFSLVTDFCFFSSSGF